MADKFKDYYEVLGLGRSAATDEIKTAYRKLARKYHPDLNPGDKAAEDRFKELQQAYEVLSEPEDRKLYDQYGENWRAVKQGAGVPPPGGSARDTAGGSGRAQSGINFDEYDFGSYGSGFDIFEEMFGRTGRGRGFTEQPTRGRDVEAELELSLEEAHRGGRRTLQMQVGEVCPTCGGTGVVAENKICPTCGGAGQLLKPKTIEVNIPIGMRQGSMIRLAGQGGPGANGTKAGDLYLHIIVRPHPTFTVHGDDVEIELPIAPWEGVLGANVEAPTIDGKVEVKVPAGAKSGQRLRLRGQGLNKRKGGRGDEFVRLKVVTPSGVNEAERKLWEELRAASTFKPRG
ncbi:MAG TPA: J domain-containing protein [Pyrinomonadaceae bacterium]|nr:J domain-containing protein [Pyrinomonadaceae bacterium]